MLPSLQFLKQIPQHIFSIPNQRKESKRREHYCLFLLSHKAGLRVSEAVNFNLAKKECNGLYRIEKSKGKKTRLVYIPKQVIRELKRNNWQPKQTNRFNFYHFLRKIKRELNLPTNIELTPHTLRKSFATYQAEAGLPLPLLQKLLGHQSIRTTALYWMNIYNDDNNDDTADILAGKNWLEKPKQPQPEPTTPIKVNLDKLPELLTPNLPLFSLPPAKHLSKINHLEEKLSQIQSENNNLKSENAGLRNDLRNSEEQNATLYQQKAQEAAERHQIQQDLTIAKETIKHLEQKLTSEQAKRTTAEANLAQEKQINQSLQETNANLTQKIHTYEQNHTSLTSTYQQALKDKQIAEKRADNYEQQLTQFTTEIKNLAKTLHQWQKLNYYQQLEKQNELKAQILQPDFKPPPWKPNK